MERAAIGLWLLVAACGRVGFSTPDAGPTSDDDARVPDASEPKVCETDVDCNGCGTCGNTKTCGTFGFTRLSLGHRTAMGTAADGSYWGWGTNDGNILQLTGTTFAVPTQLADLQQFSEAHLGSYSGDGLAADGTLWSWGSSGGAGQTSSMTGWTNLQEAWQWGCAQQGTQLWCWGDNYKGNLGDGTNNDSGPLQIAIPPVADYSIDVYTACAIDTSGHLWCWGDNGRLQAGDATPGNIEIVPTQVGTRTDWAQVAVGGDVTCAMTTPPAAVECMGASDLNGTTSDTAVPAPIDAHTNFMLVRANFDHVCALDTDGGVWCWGQNAEGQLGTGDTDSRIPPTQIPIPAAEDLVLGGHTTCAKVRGGWWCWGRNDGGEQGLGEVTANITTPFERCPL